MRKFKPQRHSRRPPRPLHLLVLEDRCLLSTYMITDLGPGSAIGINDSGLVVGGGDSGPFTWDSINGRQDLEIFGVHGPIFGAIGVSPQGLIAGRAPTPLQDNPDHAFLYDHGTVTDLGTLGGSVSAAFGVNDAGQVVGFASKAVGFHAFLWDSQNGMQDLGALRGGSASIAHGINGSGLVVGESFYFNEWHAFVWDSMNGMRDIGGSSFRSNAVGVNDAGQVVGSMNNDAFLYDGGTLIDLGSLGGVAVGNAINDAGIIVGGSGTGTLNHHGFIYRDGVMTDLNDLIPPVSGLTIVEAEGINNAGQIVGVAVQDGDYNTHAILLTPDEGRSPRSAVPGILQVLATMHESAPRIVDAAVAPDSRPAPAGAPESAVPVPIGTMASKATDAVFASIHRANTSVSASDWEVKELELGVSVLPKL
jgi:probable HAF family extracellular repeat protein